MSAGGGSGKWRGVTNCLHMYDHFIADCLSCHQLPGDLSWTPYVPLAGRDFRLTDVWKARPLLPRVRRSLPKYHQHCHDSNRNQDDNRHTQHAATSASLHRDAMTCGDLFNFPL